MPETNFEKIIPKRLNYYLNRSEMTQFELSRRLGVSSTSVSNWCNGIKTPRMDKIDKMCTIFNCSRSDLLDDKRLPQEEEETTDILSPLYDCLAAGIPLETIADEQKKIFSTNLNYLLKRNCKTQKEVANAIGVIPSTFNTWCQGVALPRMGKVQALADYFGVAKSALIEKQDFTASSPKRRESVVIPVYGRVAAGIPLEMVTDIIDTEEIPVDLARTGEFFGLQIHGNSMEPKISDGDVVIIRAQNDAESGELVIATVNGTDATCKRLKKYAQGIALVSSNPAYEPMYFTNQEIEEKPVRILGKVVELRAKF